MSTPADSLGQEAPADRCVGGHDGPSTEEATLTERTNGGRAFDTWLRRGAGVLAFALALCGALSVILYLVGDARWAGQVALAQEAQARGVGDLAAETDRKALGVQIQANREGVLLIQGELKHQTAAIRELLDRLNQRDSPPLAPAPRRRRRTP